MTHVLLDTTSESGGTPLGYEHLSRTNGAPDKGLLPGVTLSFFPSVVTRPQAYYWSKVWQEGEAEALSEIQAGETVRFDNPRDAVRWLLAADDDGDE